MLVIGIILVTIIAVAASSLDDARMSAVVNGIMVLQRASVVGSIASSHFSGSGGGDFFRYLSLVNLDIQVIKPGCKVPIIPFFNLFWSA